MGKITGLAAGGVALAALATPATAQTNAAATAQASTTIIQALTISKTSDLNFGSIVRPSGTASTITVSSAGVRSVSGGTGALAGAAGVSAAGFLIQGEGGQQFSITVPTTFKMTSGTDSLKVTLSSSTTGTAMLSGSLGSSGSLILGVGGYFKLTKTQATGAYTGSFQVTVAYD